VHAGSIEDMWQVAIEIALRAGGDRGSPGLFGTLTPPEAIKPQRLIVLETEGWASLDDASKTAFEMFLESLKELGITVRRRQEDADVEMLERALGQASRIAAGITGWENRWYQRNLAGADGAGISARALAVLERAEAMTPRDYRALLVERECAQLAHARLAPLADAAITLSCPGPAPLWLGDKPGEPLASRPTGNAIFNYASSICFAPVVGVPLMSVGGLPVGIQVMGQQHEDARVTAIARWLLENATPVVQD